MKSYTNHKTVRRPSLYYVISPIVSCREPNQSASVRLWYLHCTPPLLSAVSCQISLLQLAILSLDEWKLLLMSKFNYFQCTVTATGRFYVQVHEILYITNVDVLLTMYLSIFLVINLLTPNVNYSGRTAPLTNKVAFYIFIQQIYVPNILNMVYTLRIFLFKMQFVS